VHSIAEEAAQDESAGVPEPSADLAGLDGSIASEANPPEPEPDLDEEDDWQFTEQVRTEGDDDAAPDDDFGVGTDFSEGLDETSLSGALGEADSDLGPTAEPDVVSISDDGIDLGAEMDASGLDLESSAESDAGAGSELGLDSNELSVGDATSGIEAGHDDSSFGDVKDFSELTEDVGLETTEVESIVDADLTDDSDAGLYSSTGSTEDLGDPESWDLAPDADFNSPKASIAGLVDAFSTGASEASGPGAALSFEGELDPSDFDAELGERSKLLSGLRTVAMGLGWLGTIVVVTVVAYLSVAPEWQRWAETTQTYATDDFVAETTDTRWVDTTRAGALLVIDGVARNTGRQVIWPPPMQVALLDAEGQEISGAESAIGVPLAETVLREATLAELTASMTLAPERFRTSPLGPGEIREFQAVIAHVPDTARRVVLEPAANEATDEGIAPADADLIAEPMVGSPTPDAGLEILDRLAEPRADLGQSLGSKEHDDDHEYDPEFHRSQSEHRSLRWRPWSGRSRTGCCPPRKSRSSARR
jgi:hypothetical protein